MFALGDDQAPRMRFRLKVWRQSEKIALRAFEERSDLRLLVFFFQAEDGIRDVAVTGVQTCALPIYQLRGLTGVGQRQHRIPAGDHAEVAVPGFRGVQKKGRCAGTGKRRRDLAGDMPALAHAGDHDAAVAGEAHAAGLRERGPEPCGERLDRARLDGERAPRGSEQLLILGCRVGGGCGRRVQIHDGHYGTGWIGVRGATTEARLTSVLRRLTIISDGNHQALFEGADRVAESPPAIPALGTWHGIACWKYPARDPAAPEEALWKHGAGGGLRPPESRRWSAHRQADA